MNCPACKLPISEQTLIPLFTSEDKTDNAAVPMRPSLRVNYQHPTKTSSKLWAESTDLGLSPSMFEAHFVKSAQSLTEERGGSVAEGLVQLVILGLGTLVYFYLA
jgi:hypothetical protein